MGCDGGTIPTRDELVKLKKKPEKKDRDAELSAKWKHCAITQEPLRLPIVACELGRLFNKEAVLEMLLDKSKFECAASFSHIRGLKDVKELQLTENPSYKHLDNEKGDAYIDNNKAYYICPVTGLEMNGKHKFCFWWSCGCVQSERAMKEVKSDVCHKCGKQTDDTDDLVALNGTEDEVDTMKSNMEARRLRAKLAKKAKKKKAEATECVTEGPSTSKQVKLDMKEIEGKKTTGDIPVKSKLANGTFSGKTSQSRSNDKKAASLQDDPTASKAYKSLFTTSEAGKKQKTAHWVTMNPLYY